MNKQLQFLAAVLVCFLFPIDCHAQSEQEKERAMLLKINPDKNVGPGYGINARAFIDSVSFTGINGEFDPLLKFKWLVSIQLLKMENGWLERIAKSYPDLSSLDFDASLLKDDELNIVGEFKNLDRLVITGANTDGAACLRKISQLVELRSLTIPLGWEQHLNELSVLTKLESLRIGTRNWSTNAEETFISTSPEYQNFHHLYRFLIDEQKRSVSEAAEITGMLKEGRFLLPELNDDLVPYLNELENIDEMTLGIGELSKEGLGIFKLPSGLKKLCLTGNRSLELFDQIQPNSIEHVKIEGNNSPLVHQIRGIEGLKKFEISHYQIGPEGLSIGEGFEKVEYLDFEMCGISKDCLSFVAGLKNLKHLDLSNNQLTELDGLQFENLRELTYLDLSDNLLSQFDFKQISELNKLVHLDLGEVSIRDADLTHFSNLKNLNKLDWMGGQTTPQSRFKLYRDLDWGIEKLLKSEGVRVVKGGARINISKRAEISDELVQAFGHLNSPSELWVFGNTAAIKIVSVHPFQKLRLISFEELNKESIELLSKNQSIKFLEISNAKNITDEGFKHLEKMTWLEELYIRQSGISEAAKEALKAKLPNCKIR